MTGEGNRHVLNARADSIFFGDGFRIYCVGRNPPQEVAEVRLGEGFTKDEDRLVADVLQRKDNFFTELARQNGRVMEHPVSCAEGEKIRLQLTVDRILVI